MMDVDKNPGLHFSPWSPRFRVLLIAMGAGSLALLAQEWGLEPN